MTDIAGERAALAAVGLHMRTREQWDAQQSYTSDRRVDSPAKWLFLHITVTPDPANTPAAEDSAFRVVESIGQSRFGIGCSYNAMVTDTGTLAEGQPITRRGAHTVNDREVPGFPSGSLNYGGRAIAVVQNVGDDVTAAQVDSIARWFAALKLSGLARMDAGIYGHRDFAFKSCPGDAAYGLLPQIRTLTAFYVANGLSPEEDDLPYTEQQFKSMCAEAVGIALTTGGSDARVALGTMFDSQRVKLVKAPDGGAGHWWVTNGIVKRNVSQRILDGALDGHAHVKFLVEVCGVGADGKDASGNYKPFTVTWADLNAIPTENAA